MPTRRALLLPTASALVLGRPASGQAQPGRPADRGSVTATTHRGKVRGVVQDGIRVFKGVPYAASTDGPNRMRAPRPAPAWTGVRDAFAFGPNCPQLPTRPLSLTASWSRDAAMAEDCLTLNIWTPGLRDQRKRPVMVWFHSGGFQSGSASLSVYDGQRLARRGDVVVVTVNHRLNLFGHLYLAQLGGAEFAESGNAGLLDLIAALRWINATIVEFGGDPANVTIFGQSGGGAKVSLLLGMPQARGLFHRAIVQSGSQLDVQTQEEATRNAAALLAALDIKPQETARIRTLAVDRLLAAMTRVAAAPGARLGFGPVLDGVAIPRQPWSPDAPATSAGVPLLVGTTATETTSLIGGDDASAFSLTDGDLAGRLRGWLPDRDVERVITGYRRIMPNASAADLFFAITAARRARQPAWTQAERKAAQGGAPVWLYELEWQTPVEGGKWRAPNGLDVPLVFDAVARSESMVGSSREAQAMADHLAATWIAFARTGQPHASREPAWPAFNPRDRATMLLDLRPRVVNDHRGAERALLAPLPAYRVIR